MGITAVVEWSPEFSYEGDGIVPKGQYWIGGGATSALRLYRAHHPAARCHIVTYRGRTVWLTEKQFSIWCDIQASWRRRKWLTLKQIADRVQCSRATVSRFLHRLNFWRFIDLGVMRGRGGGIYVASRKFPDIGREAPMWDTGARPTRKMRKLAASRFAWMIRRVEKEMRELVERAKSTRLPVGNTGATFNTPLMRNREF